VKRKQALKEELRKKSLAGMAKHSTEKKDAVNDNNDDDNSDKIDSRG